LGLDAEQSEAVEKLTRGIVNKIMHAPISRLRDETDREIGLARLEEARSLFALDESDADVSIAQGRPGDHAGDDVERDS
jgi:glutamyl-tRNA reductase